MTISSGLEQLRALGSAIADRIVTLEQQRSALSQTLSELREIDRQTDQKLAERAA